MLRRLFRLLRHPVDPETRQLLRHKWQQLPRNLRTPHQLYGRYDEGCGATVGVMPRCDFACRGCYLGEQANSVPPQPVEQIKAQMRALRPYLGQWGNLQLTDGEVTLRDEEELLELLQYARQLELVPMLMTHGDTFRRRPGLLRRLVIEGGLREVSLHIDTTQRGREGPAYRSATTEVDLHPLRGEFAELIRSVRNETGQPLRAASTVTVSRENLSEVCDVVRWFLSNSDVFRLVSFLPMAQVGRTMDGLGGGVDLDSLWRQIGRGLPSVPEPDELADHQWWLGHPACNRILTGFTCVDSKGKTDFQPLSPRDALDRRFVDEFLDRFGGLTFRADTRMQSMARAMGMFLQAPGLMAVSLPRYVLHWLGRFAPEDRWKLGRRLLTGSSHAHSFTIVSHHFMNRREIESPLGRERTQHCVFQVPVDGELVSMCEFNATGGRERYYDRAASDQKTKPLQVLP